MARTNLPRTVDLRLKEIALQLAEEASREPDPIKQRELTAKAIRAWLDAHGEGANTKIERILERARAATSKRRQRAAQRRYVETGEGIYAYSPDRMRRISLGKRGRPEVLTPDGKWTPKKNDC
jgi:hypothetical protein